MRSHKHHLKRNTSASLFTIGLLSASLLVTSNVANAAGGGGGGGSAGGAAPSQSAPRYNAAAEYRKGVEALQTKDYKKAITAFRRTISVSPKNANAHYLLGVSYMGQDNFKKARKSLLKAVKHNDALVDAHRDLAITYHNLSQADKANKILNELLSKQETCGDNCPSKLNEAITVIKSTIAGDQASLKTYHDRQLAHNFAALNSQTGDKIYVSAVALINEHKYTEAIAELELASQSFGPHPDILTYLGFANRKLKNFDVAEKYYKSALQVAPNHLGANEYFGELMIEHGDIAGAKSQLAKPDALCDFGCYEAEELRRWVNAATTS